MTFSLYQVPYRPPFPVRFRGKYVFFTESGMATAGFVGELDNQSYLLPLIWEILDSKLLEVLDPEDLEATDWTAAPGDELGRVSNTLLLLTKTEEEPG